MKTIGLMPRRPDTSRAGFREHYETRHAPLALGKFPFRKYVRNHVVASTPDPIGFDCLSEFWIDDVAEVLRIMAGEIGDVMREDERRFTDQPRIGPAVAVETQIYGPPRVFEDGVVRKVVLLLQPAKDVVRETFLDATIAWGEKLASAGHLARLTFDSLTPFEGRYWPGYEGLLYAWPNDEGNALWSAVPPAEIEIGGRIRTETIETRLD